MEVISSLVSQGLSSMMISFVRIMSRDHCCSLNGTLYPPNGTVMTIIKDESGCDQVLSQYKIVYLIEFCPGYHEV